MATSEFTPLFPGVVPERWRKANYNLFNNTMKRESAQAANGAKKPAVKKTAKKTTSKKAETVSTAAWALSTDAPWMARALLTELASKRDAALTAIPLDTRLCLIHHLARLTPKGEPHAAP